MSYQRKFVRLEPAYAGGKSLGKAILETQGGVNKVSILVQNLKPQTIYTAYLTTDLGDLELAMIGTDKKGAGEIKQELRETTSQGVSAEVIGSIVVLERESKTKVLEGKTGYVVTAPPVVENHAPETAKEPHREAQKMEVATHTPESETPDFLEDPPTKVYIPEAQKDSLGIKSLDLAMAELEQLLANNTPMMPFKSQRKDFKWVRMSLKETIYLPVHMWSVSQDAFVKERYEAYNHLILGGYDGQQKEYLFGLPDVFSYKNKPAANSKGFVQFKGCDNNALKEGDGGYWIMPIYL